MRAKDVIKACVHRPGKYAPEPPEDEEEVDEDEEEVDEDEEEDDDEIK